MENNLISKVRKSFQSEGLLKTALKVIKYPINLLRKRRFKKNVLLPKSTEDRFTWIYENSHWGNHESLSGTGSTLKYTEKLRKELPSLLKDYSIFKLFDAPCGDFHWMQHLLPSINVEYIGGDIVKTLIEELNKKHGNGKVSFIHVDLIKDMLPQVDLMICRDCLFHLSYEDTRLLLNNFLNSGTPYLLTTTHKNATKSFANKDIITGDFRLLDLFSAPYNFSFPPLATIDDWIPPDPERQMCLWNREHVSTALSKFKPTRQQFSTLLN